MVAIRKPRMSSHIMTMCLVACLTGMFMLVGPIHQVRATSSLYGCFFPSANHEYYVVNGVDQGTDTDGGPKVCLDGNYIEIAQPHGYSSSTNLLRTNDYNNPDYQAGPFAYSFWSGDHAPDNATIVSVWVIVVFHGANPEPSAMQLTFSTNGSAGPWATPASVSQDGTWISRLNAWSANITSLRSWTPTLLKSTSLFASFYTTLSPSTNTFQIDYLGFNYDYLVPYGGGYIPGMPPGGWNNETTPITLDIFSNVNGMLGMTGFIGVVATPALALIYAKHAEGGALKALIVAIVMGGFSFSMLIVSLGI